MEKVWGGFLYCNRVNAIEKVWMPKLVRVRTRGSLSFANEKGMDLLAEWSLVTRHECRSAIVPDSRNTSSYVR